jgi:concanavalin A-like lectin/glucanase superfamily protein
MRLWSMRLLQGLCACLVLSLPSLAAATDRYVSPGGSGSTCSSGSPCSVQQCVALANTPGDRCLFQNGTYTGDASMLEVSNKTGTSSAPIIFAAINEGQVLLNGQHTRGMIHIYNSDWVEVVGLNTCCAAYDNTGNSSGFPLWLQETNNCTVRRTIAWDADGASGNTIPMIVSSDGLTGRGNDNTLIDVAAWGGGRKAFNAFRDNRTTILRAFFMKNYYDGSITDGGVATSYAYDSIDSRRYNVIATGDLFSGGNGNMYGLFDKDHYLSWCSSGYTDVYHLLHGNIAYHVDGQVLSNTSWAMGLNMGCGQVETSGCPTGGPVVHITAINNLALRRNAASPPEGINGEDNTCGGSNFYDTWTDSLGSLAGGTHSTDGGNLAYPGGFNNGLLNLGAASQPSSGAWIRYAYKLDGTLDTTFELWPWPMEDRIREALFASGYNSRGIDGAGSTSVTATISALTGSSITTAPPPTPLLLLWPFDEPSGSVATDTSGNSPAHDGTLVGSPGHVPGIRGTGALSFNGTNQYVENTSFTLPAGSPITVSFWITTLPSTGDHGAFSFGPATPGLDAACYVPAADTRIYCYYGSAALSADFTAYVNQPTHVAFVSNGGDFTAIYLNGVRVATTASGGAPTSDLTGLTVGKYANLSGTVWTAGTMDHFFVENRVLSDTEIQAQFQAVTHAVQWRFDEPSGSVAADTSPAHLYDGTLIGAPLHQPGIVGPFSLGFNGVNQRVENTTFPWPVGTPITIMFWVNTAGGTPAVAVNIGGQDPPNRIQVHAPWSDNTLYWDYGDFSAAGRISTDFTPYLNQPTHVAVVNNGTNFKAIYINGAQVTPANTTAITPTIDVAGLYVGSDGTGTSWQTGTMDNVRIEPRVLSAAEILAEFQLRTTIVPGLPVGWAPSSGFFLLPN